MNDDLVSSPSINPTDPAKSPTLPENPKPEIAISPPSIAVSGDSISTNIPLEPPPSSTNITPPPSSQETPPPHIVSPISGGKSRVKVILSAIALLLFLASIPAAVFLIQQRQEISKKAAESAPSCPAGFQDLGTYGECCDCQKAVEVRYCKNPDTGEETWTKSDCVHDASNCTQNCPPPGGQTCTYGQTCDASGHSGTQSCTGTVQNGECKYDPGVSPNCSSCTWCGDGNCGGGEGIENCPQDCGAPSGTWYQCVTDGPEPNLPCGSCSVTNVGPGTMTFSCELDCGGSASRCPGGSAGSYSIAHHWQRCQKAGTNACTETSGASDYITSGTLGGPGPWTISGQSTVNGSGTFTNPGCGRVQVDVQMSAAGTNVAGGVYDTGKDCLGPIPTPTPTPTPGPSGITCNTSEISLSVSPSTVEVGQSINFIINGNASTWIGDDYQGAVINCSGSWNYRTCAANKSGTYTWTHTWKNCIENVNNCSGLCSKTASFTITAPPSPTAQCLAIKAYNTSWSLLDTSKLSQLKTGDTVRFAVLGQTSSGNFEKARFRVNSTSWLPETTTKKPNTEEFYVEYTIPSGVTSFNVEAEIYHPTLGWQ